jgi:2-methylcitrate dehydratase PrpD
MLAQYSIPFCVALALHREARDPESWDETALADPQIRALCRRVRLVPERSAEHAGMASTVTIALADGRHFDGRAENGMLEPGELEDKFRRLTRAPAKPLRRHSSDCKARRRGSLDWLSEPLSAPRGFNRAEYRYPHTSLAVSVCGLTG